MTTTPIGGYTQDELLSQCSEETKAKAVKTGQGFTRSQPSTGEFSGRQTTTVFTLRIPAAMAEALREEAKAADTSVNLLLASKAAIRIPKDKILGKGQSLMKAWRDMEANRTGVAFWLPDTCKPCGGEGYLAPHKDDLRGPTCRHCGGSGRVDFGSGPKGDGEPCSLCGLLACDGYCGPCPTPFRPSGNKDSD